MKRAFLQIYTINSVEAVEFYKRAFDATLGYHVKSEDGSYYHAELEVYGQVIAVAEKDKTISRNETGNTLQYCLHFEEGEEESVKKAYEVLKEGAKINVPLGPCEFANMMTDLTDKFAVRWCLFL